MAFIDVGTYSVRLLLVRINPNQSYSVIGELKEPVRLGGDEFEHNRLQSPAIARAVHVCRRFAEMARRSGAREIIAVATSATREAENQRDFLRRLRLSTGLDVRVISGREEARLIYLGVSRGLHLGGRPGLFIDIGGGSTELAVGDDRDYRYLDSLKLGTIRLTQAFGLDRPDKPLGASRYAEVRAYARSAAVRTIAQLRQHRFGLVVGSSGTIRNLAGIAAQRAGRPATVDPWLTRAELRTVATELRRKRQAERMRIPGLNPERADVIVAGAAILETLMDELGLDRLQTTRSGLRDGLLVDYLVRRRPTDELYALSPRRRSVLLLGRRCTFDEPHAQRVAALALELFDSARRLGLHKYAEAERELLEYAALLHDIGVFLSFVNHQAHTHYLIRNADLVGFDQTEIAVIAALARFHRKGRPRATDPELAELDLRARRVVQILYVFLRLAERLERSHHGVIQHAQLRRAPGGAVVLQLRSEGDCTLEVMAAAKDQKAFERAFHRRLLVRQSPRRRARRA